MAKLTSTAPKLVAVVACVSAVFGQAAHSQSVRAYDAPPSWFFNEVRLGGFAHGVGTPERGSADVNAELLTQQIFRTEDQALQRLVPRLHVGGSFNTGHGTNQGYAGLTWTQDILPRVFIEGSFGGSLNDGKTGDRFTPLDRAKLGCHVLFRESASLGYRITDHLSVMATADHISNGTLCDYNRGLNNYGMRIGYTF